MTYLIASMIVRNEFGRYMEQCLGHLLEFCDEVRILDDGSDDGSAEWLSEVHHAAVQVQRAPVSGFFAHEGRARQTLLEWTLAGDPSHVLAVDADEFVTDGMAVRRACEGSGGTWDVRQMVWTLGMEEVWELDGGCLCVREDGGWRSHPVPVLYRVPEPTQRDHTWVIHDRALACGREPVAVRRVAGLARPSGSDLLHFGWANQAERQARYDRYAAADGGRFHAGAHLQSILWPDDRVELRGREWPAALASYRAALTGRVHAA